jgi:hypothetical protein
VESILEESAARAAVTDLVARKQAGDELAVAPSVEALNEPDDATDAARGLNRFFRRYALAA